MVAIRWSLGRPSLFFVLDDRCYITTFDLLSKTPSEPTHVEQFGKKERIVSFELAKAGKARCRFLCSMYRGEAS